MPAIGDLLSDRDRYRLEHLADPNPGLAEAARATVADATGVERLAWAAVAVALGKTQTPAEARSEVAELIEDDQMRAMAIGCLDALCRDDATTRTP